MTRVKLCATLQMLYSLKHLGEPQERRMTAAFTKAAAVGSVGRSHCPTFNTYQFSEFIEPLT